MNPGTETTMPTLWNLLKTIEYLVRVKNIRWVVEILKLMGLVHKNLLLKVAL
jgi:hypothetical protein